MIYEDHLNPVELRQIKKELLLLIDAQVLMIELESDSDINSHRFSFTD